MIENGVDITILSGTVQDNRLVARRLSPIDFVTCASPDYISRYPELSDGVFSASESIGLHRWIQFRFAQTIEVLPIKLVAPVVRLDGYGVFVMYPRREYLPTKVRVFIDFLARKLVVIDEGPGDTWTSDQLVKV